MIKTAKDHLEKFNSIVSKATEISGATIKAIIDISSSGLNNSIDANQEFLDFIKNQLLLKGLDLSLISTVKKTFSNGVHASEQMIDAIVAAHSNRLDFSIKFNLKLIKLLEGQSFTSEIEKEKTFVHIIENFESAFNASHDELKDILGFYNKHINIALNFNQHFEAAFRNQIEIMNKMQNSGVNLFTHQATQWWKENITENESIFVN